MRRLTVLLFVIAACGGTASDQASTTDAAEATTSSATDSPTTSSDADQAPTASVSDSSAATDSDRPLAPDFTLELGEGGRYTLSEGTKPVYLIFWAEW